MDSSKVDWSYSWGSCRRLLKKGLAQIEDQQTRGPAVEALILSMHIYDCIPAETFDSVAASKTDFLMDYLSACLSKEAASELERLAKHAVIYEGIKQFGAFYVIISLFFAFYRRTTGFDYLNITLACIEAYRAKLHPVSLRIRFYSRVYRMLELGFHDLAYSRTGEKQAVALFERMKARGFLDVHAIIKSGLSASLPMQWGDYDVTACPGKEEPAVLSIRTTKVPYTNPLDDFSLYSREELFEFTDACSAYQIDDWDLPAKEPPGVSELVRRIPQNSLYISFLQVDEKLFAVTLCSGREPRIFRTDTHDFSDYELAPEEREFARVVRLLKQISALGLPIHHRSLKTPDTRSKREFCRIKAHFGEFYDLIFREMEALDGSGETLHDAVKGIDTLLFAPAFPLQGVPLSLLHDGKGFLIEKRVVSFVPNATWFAFTEAMSFKLAKVLILADPIDDLPGARSEARVVAEILERKGLQVTHLAGKDVERNWLLRNAQAFDLIHFAGHGNYNLTESSYLLLADGDRLTLDDILRARWRPAFFFANACRSGERKAHMIEETLSFASGLLAAGSSAVLAALWYVEDKAAVDFAGGFYDALLSGKNIGHAYQDAMKSQLRTDSDRMTWAPYTLIGHPNLQFE